MAPGGGAVPNERGTPVASSRFEQVLSLTCSSFEAEPSGEGEREFFIDNLLVRNHFIIVMTTGLAPCKFEFPFPGSLTPTFLV